jgi:predicted CopG family antitoxin
MTVKTIKIDLEAYTLLSRRKRAGQSFSEVIKAHFGREPTAGRFRTLVQTIRLSDTTLDAIERQIRARRRDGGKPAGLSPRVKSRGKPASRMVLEDRR